MSSKPTLDHGLWLDTRGYRDGADRPTVDRNGWKTLVEFSGVWDLREFWRLNHVGQFYVRRPLLEDSTSRERGARAGTILGIESAMAYVTEAVAAILAFAKSLVAERKDERIGILFRFKGLQERRLQSLAGGAAQLIAFENRSTQNVMTVLLNCR